MDDQEKLKMRRKFINDLRRHLKKFNAFETIDKHAMDRIADWHVLYHEMKLLIVKHGSVSVSEKSGYVSMNGYQQTLNQAEHNLQILYSKFGIDTITRDKLKFESKKKETQDDGLIK